MNGAIPLLPLYALMVWTGKYMLYIPSAFKACSIVGRF